MSLQTDPSSIRWLLHLNSPIQKVYQAISTDSGRASFWAESAEEHDGIIHFLFPNQVAWDGRVLEASGPHRYVVQYYGDSLTEFTLKDDGQGGTDLALEDTGVPAEYRTEVTAGWVSVLMALKAAVDFGVDLRNHDTRRDWDHGYVEN